MGITSIIIFLVKNFKIIFGDLINETINLILEEFGLNIGDKAPVVEESKINTADKTPVVDKSKINTADESTVEE